MPNIRVPVPSHMPSYACSFLFLCSVLSACFPGVHGRHWKENGGQEERRRQGIYPSPSLLSSWSSSVAADPREQDHCSSSFCLPTPPLGFSDLDFPYIPLALGAIEASCICLSLGCLIFFCLASQFFPHMCK